MADPRAHRRRRAAALSAVAGLALIVGIAVGATTDRTSRHEHQSALSTPALRRLAQRAARRQVPTSLSERENAAIDDRLARTPYVRMAGTQHRELALTFDDGPGPYTPQILAILRRTHTPATFFEVGEEDRYFGSSTARIVAMDDPIGDHTETHAPMSQLSYRRQERELLQQSAATGAYGAAFPRMFRPPYGLWNDTTLRLLDHLHLLMVLWSVDTDDWQRPGTAVIVSAALKGSRPGAIILMHDAGGDRSQTVAALPTIIRVLRRRGYRLVTVPRLLLDNPAPRQQDVAALKGEGG
jgi:peptidoglycan/xylan/chitin deacetylase (PgdA/CDA1 family)